MARLTDNKEEELHEDFEQKWEGIDIAHIIAMLLSFVFILVMAAQ